MGQPHLPTRIRLVQTQTRWVRRPLKPAKRSETLAAKEKAWVTQLGMTIASTLGGQAAYRSFGALALAAGDVQTSLCADIAGQVKMEKIYSFSILKPASFTKVEPAMKMRLDDRHLSKSALRALDVLEFCALSARPVRATEVAKALGLSPSTADQLLKTLASRAYLLFDVKQKLYRLSPRLLGFAGILEKSYFGGDNLQTLMQDLVERTGCLVGIGTPFGRVMQLVDCAAPPGQSYEEKPGFTFPLFSSAAGTVLLAQWPLATVRTLIAQSKDQLGSLADTPDTILDHLSEVRANGHAFGGLSDDAEKCSIAVALPLTHLGAELSISLRGKIEEMKARRWRLSALIHEAITEHLHPTGRAH